MGRHCLLIDLSLCSLFSMFNASWESMCLPIGAHEVFVATPGQVARFARCGKAIQVCPLHKDKQKRSALFIINDVSIELN